MSRRLAAEVLAILTDSAKPKGVDYSLLPVGPLPGRTLPGGRTYTQAVGANQTEETVQTSASTVARWNFIADRPRIGLLADGGTGLVLEPPRTNRAVRSDAIDNGSWFVESGAVSRGANVTASPTGTVDAESVSWTSGALRYIGQTISFALETSTISIWAKVSSGKIRLRLPSQVGVSNVDSEDLTPTSSWAAFAHTVTNVTTAGPSSAIVESDVANGAMSGHMWGAQVEAGKYRTNWLPTVAGNVSRAGFRLQVSIHNLVRGGTFRATISHVPWADCTAYDGDTATVRLWTIDANTYAEINTSTRVLIVCVNGVSRVAAVPIWWLKGHRIEWYWSVGNGALYVRYKLSTDKGVSYTLPFDPFAGVVNTDAAISTSATQVDLYSDGSGKWFGNGACREDLVYSAPAWALQALPTDVASVQAFFRADHSVTLSGSSVTGWGSNGAVAITAFSQGVGANQPTFAASGLGTARPSFTYDGANDYLEAGPLSEWITSRGAVYVLFKANSVSTNNTPNYNNHPLWENIGAYAGIGLRTGPIAGGFNYDGTYDDASVSFALSTSQVVRWRHDVSNLYVRVGTSGESAPTASGATSLLTGNNRIGGNPGAVGVYFNGHIAAVVAMNTQPTTNEDVAIMSFLNAYGGL